MSSSSPKGPWRSAVEDKHLGEEALARRREALANTEVPTHPARAIAITLWPLAAALAVLAAGHVVAVVRHASGPWPWFSLAAFGCAAAGVWVGARLARR